MSLVGFDIGNNSCVVALAKQKAIQIVLNNDSEHETPSIISFGGGRRKFGSEVSGSRLTNPTTTTISQLKRLIGKKFSDVEEELNNFPIQIREDKDGGILIHVNNCGEKYQFKPVHILAMLLSHLKEMVEKSTDSGFSQCVIGVPSYFTNQERMAYQDAARIAGLNNLQLVHEGTAIALGYGFYRTTKKNPNSCNVVFVDIGHSDTQVTVVRFQGEDMYVLAHASDPNLGGRDFDMVLFSHFSKKFKGSSKIDIAGNARACGRLMEACEKLKRQLTTNNDGRISVDGLINSKDLSGSITRRKFEELSEPLLRRVWDPCLRALEDARLSKFQAFTVELVGSGSRIPAISTVLEAQFGRPLSRTLNASECVARGCALQALVLSAKSRIELHKVYDCLPFHVSAKREGPSLTNEGLVMHKGERFPITLPFVFQHKNETFDVLLSVGQHNKSQLTGVYKVGNLSTSSDSLPTLDVEIGVDGNGIIFMHSAKLSKVQRDQTSGHALTTTATKGPPEELEVTDVFHLGVTQTDLVQIKAIETMLTNQDKSAEEAQQRRNELEGYIVETKRKLTRGVYQDVVSFSENEKYLKILDEMENWLEHHDEKPDIYLAMLEELEKLFYPIEKRIIEREENQRALDLLSVRIREYGDKASKLSDPQDMCQGTRGKLIRNLLQPSNSNPNTNSNSNPIVYFDIKIGKTMVGWMVFQLFMDVVPKTAENFLALCTGKKQVSYLGSLIHQVIPGKSCLSGVHAEDKRMILGVPSFAQENFVKKHSRRGMVSMMTDLHTPTMSHGSGFIICFRNAPELDGKYVVFGEIKEGMDVLDQIEAVGGTNGVTKKPVVIIDCGLIN